MSTFAEEYPFSGNRLDLGGVTMHYLDEGSGEVVVMLHGNPTWSFFYRDLIKALAPRYRCIVPDHIGMGYSEKPQMYNYTLKTHIDNLERLLHATLPQTTRVTLVLHDWGGAIGMGWAVRHPERVARIVVLNTAAFLSRRIPLRISLCRIPLLGSLAVRGCNLFAGAAVRMATTQPGGLTGAVREGFLKPYDNWAHRIATHRFVQDIPLQPGAPSYDTLSMIDEKLAMFKDTPMLIQWGARDFCFNRHFLRTWNARFPEAALTVYEDAGHYLLEDAGDKVIPRISAWLQAESEGA